MTIVSNTSSAGSGPCPLPVHGQRERTKSLLWLTRYSVILGIVEFVVEDIVDLVGTETLSLHRV